MSTYSLQGWLKKNNLWEYRKRIGHVTFWVIIAILLCLADFSQAGWPMVVYRVLIDVLFYVLIVYFNFLYLIPNYLTSKKFIWYCLLLIGVVFLLTPIKILLQVLLSNESPNFQLYYVQNQSYYFLNMFLVTCASTLFRIISDWVIHQKERMELQTQTMQSELKFLRSQINPHFLFNTLNNLYALTLKKSDDAPEIVLKLSEMMRYMLYECNERRVLLSKEISYLKNYLDLERLRQGKNVDINLSIDGIIQDQKIAPLLFIPFVENSFKHGVSSLISMGYVNIDIHVNNQNVRFEIENSKAPAKPQYNHKKSGGIGLVNVRRRLNLLYPNQYELNIRNKPDAYSVELLLNL